MPRVYVMLTHVPPHQCMDQGFAPQNITSTAAHISVGNFSDSTYKLTFDDFATHFRFFSSFNRLGANVFLTTMLDKQSKFPILKNFYPTYFMSEVDTK